MKTCLRKFIFAVMCLAASLARADIIFHNNSTYTVVPFSGYTTTPCFPPGEAIVTFLPQVVGPGQTADVWQGDASQFSCGLVGNVDTSNPANTAPGTCGWGAAGGGHAFAVGQQMDVYFNCGPTYTPPPTPPSNYVACVDIYNTSDTIQYMGVDGQFLDGAGAHDEGLQQLGTDCEGNPADYVSVAPGQHIHICVTINNPSGANAQGVAAFLVAYPGAQPCMSDCTGQSQYLACITGGGTPIFSGNFAGPAGGLVTTPVTNGTPPSDYTSTNIEGLTNTLTGVTYTNDMPGSGPIYWGATNLNLGTSELGALEIGFDALYDASTKILTQLQGNDSDNAIDLGRLGTNINFGLQGQTAALQSNLLVLNGTLIGISNAIDSLQNNGGSNGSGIVQYSVAQSNQFNGLLLDMQTNLNDLGFVNLNLQSLTNQATSDTAYMGGIQSNTAAANGVLSNLEINASNLNLSLSGASNLDNTTASNTGRMISNLTQLITVITNGLNVTNLAAPTNDLPYLAAISNNTAQPNLYTNTGYGGFDTNVQNIEMAASNAVGAVASSLDGLAGPLTTMAAGLDGGHPGGNGSIFTLSLSVPDPAHAGGIVNYTLDANPMDYPAVADIANFMRKAVTWMVFLGVLFKVLSDLMAGVQAMLGVAQGQVPRVEILGNTVGWALAGVYIVALAAVMIAVPFVAITWLSTGFGSAMLSGVVVNPFASVGYGTPFTASLWLADQFVPLFFLVEAVLYYAAFRLLMVKILTVCAVIVRWFMA